MTVSSSVCHLCERMRTACDRMCIDELRKRKHDASPIPPMLTPKVQGMLQGPFQKPWQLWPVLSVFSCGPLCHAFRFWPKVFRKLHPTVRHHWCLHRSILRCTDTHMCPSQFDPVEQSCLQHHCAARRDPRSRRAV